MIELLLYGSAMATVRAMDLIVSLPNNLLEINWDTTGADQGNSSDHMMILLERMANSKTLANIFDFPSRAAGNYSLPTPAPIWKSCGRGWLMTQEF